MPYHSSFDASSESIPAPSRFCPGGAVGTGLRERSLARAHQETGVRAGMNRTRNKPSRLTTGMASGLSAPNRGCAFRIHRCRRCGRCRPNSGDEDEPSAKPVQRSTNGHVRVAVFNRERDMAAADAGGGNPALDRPSTTVHGSPYDRAKAGRNEAIHRRSHARTPQRPAAGGGKLVASPPDRRLTTSARRRGRACRGRKVACE